MLISYSHVFNMQPNYVDMQHNYLTCNIIMLHDDIIYLACWGAIGQKYASVVYSPKQDNINGH